MTAVNINASVRIVEETGLFCPRSVCARIGYPHKKKHASHPDLVGRSGK